MELDGQTGQPRGDGSWRTNVEEALSRARCCLRRIREWVNGVFVDRKQRAEGRGDAKESGGRNKRTNERRVDAVNVDGDGGMGMGEKDPRNRTTNG